MLRLPQSTVSRHLKTLADGGWVTSRREATSRLYTVDAAALPDSAKGLWQVVRGQVGSAPGAAADARRLARVLDARRADLAGVLRRRGRRVGPAPRRAVRRVHAGQGAARAARSRLGRGRPRLRHRPRRVAGRAVRAPGHRRRRLGGDARRGARTLVPDNVDLRQGTLEALPIGDGEVDVALLVLVLHHVPDPARALAEAARVLRPGGRLVVVDMLPHDREDYRQHMGHVWLGFGEPQIVRLLHGARFEAARVVPLAPEASAEGPPLFLAAARQPVIRSLTNHKETADVRCRRNPACLRRRPQGRPRTVQGQGPRAWPSSAATKSAWPSTRCPGLMALRARYSGQEAARRREDHGLAAHDGADRRADRDADRARRRRALGELQHLLDAGSAPPPRSPSAVPRSGGTRRQPAAARRCSRGRARRSPNTGGARSKRSCGPTAAARR